MDQCRELPLAVLIPKPTQCSFAIFQLETFYDFRVFSIVIKFVIIQSEATSQKAIPTLFRYIQDVKKVDLSALPLGLENVLPYFFQRLVRPGLAGQSR